MLPVLDANHPPIRVPRRVPAVSRALAAAAAAAALAACAGTSPTPAAPAAGAPRPRPTCELAVERLFAITSTDARPEVSEVATRVFLRHCDEQGWSDEVRGCMMDLETKAGADACEALLTYDQRMALRNDLMEALDAVGVKPEVQSGRPKRAPDDE